MPRSIPAVRALALLLAGALAACGRADAAAGEGKGGAASPAVAAVATTPAASGDTLTDSALVERADRGRIKGKDQAMWVVMISDYQCPYCKNWHDSSMTRVEQEYIAPGKIRFAHLHLPLSSIHPHARKESEAALCAGVQGKFWPYSEALFAAQPTVASMTDITPLLDRIARDLALDSAAFTRCRGSKAVASLVNNDIAQATQAKVQSTPTFIIGDFLIQGALPYPEFRKAVDTALVVARTKGTR